MRCLVVLVASLMSMVKCRRFHIPESVQYGSIVGASSVLVQAVDCRGENYPLSFGILLPLGTLVVADIFQTLVDVWARHYC